MEMVLVYDVGTSSVKASLFTMDGRMYASTSAPYATSYPRPGWAEQDPTLFWEATIAATRSLLQEEGVAVSSIEGIGLAGHMNGALLVDEHGAPTHPFLIHSDSRSTVQRRRLERLWGQKELYRRTGNRTDEKLSLPKAMWIKDEEPEAFARSRWMISAKDYLRFKLTGSLGTTDYSDASLTGAFNIGGRRWDEELLSSVSIPATMMPYPRAATELDGTLSTQAAELLGLSAGLPVSTGGGDAASATRGAFIDGPNRGYLCLGTSAWISTLSVTMVTDPAMRLQHFFDLDGRMINLCATVQSAGSAIQWARSLLWDSSEYRDEHASTQSAGVLFLPYLQGERTPHWDATSRGLFFGLSLSTTKSAMMRAVYEGVCFALREALEVYGDLNLLFESFTLMGGAINDPLLEVLLADILGRDLLYHPYPSEATGLGAALAAMVAIGAYRSLDAAVSAIDVEYRQRTFAVQRWRRYHKSYATYKRLYPAISHLFGSEVSEEEQR
jgi:xylulokinase